MKSITKQLQKFLASRQRNSWIGTPDLEVYIRLSRRTFSSDQSGISSVSCLDIANISQLDQSKGKGHFRDFIEYAEIPNRWYTHIYFENVLNVNLVGMLLRNGYQEVSMKLIDHPPCLYKELR